MTEKLRAKSRHPAAQAPCARTTCSERTAPWSVRTTAGRDRSTSVTRVRSKMRTPRSSRRRRSPRANRDRQRVAQTLLFAEQPGQRRKIPPRRREEPAVAPARAAADDVLLQHRDPKTRLALAEADRGPQPGEAAAHDAHVGDDVRLQWR